MYFKDPKYFVLHNIKREWENLTPHNKERHIKKIKKIFRQGLNFLKRGYKVHLYCVSGEGNWRFWNELTKELIALKENKNFIHHHKIGPIISCNDSFYNIIIESFNPQNSKYGLRKLRFLTHYIIIEAFKETSPFLPEWFAICYEDYHLPLQKERKYVLFEVDKNHKEYIKYLNGLRLLLFEFKNILCDEIVDINILKKFYITDKEFKTILTNLKEKRLNFDNLIFEDIKGFLP